MAGGRLYDTSIHTSCPLGQLDTPVSSWEQDSDKLTFTILRQERQADGTPTLPCLYRSLRPPIDSTIMDMRTEDSSQEEEGLSWSVWTLCQFGCIKTETILKYTPINTPPLAVHPYKHSTKSLDCVKTFFWKRWTFYKIK